MHWHLQRRRETPAAIEHELLGYLDAASKSGSYSDGYDEEKNTKANDAIRQTLERAGKRLDVLHYAFPNLKKRMAVATSCDGKLRIYSWDLETGGTMHDFECVYQYQGNSGTVRTWSASDDPESAGGYYTEMFQVDTKNGPIYLANSNFIAAKQYSWPVDRRHADKRRQAGRKGQSHSHHERADKFDRFCV